MGNCVICWSAIADIDVQVSGAISGVLTKTTVGCCDYGTLGTKELYDCIIIPGALKSSKASALNVPADAQCGISKGLVTMEGMVPKTVCCKLQTFLLGHQRLTFPDDPLFSSSPATLQYPVLVRYV